MALEHAELHLMAEDKSITETLAEFLKSNMEVVQVYLTHMDEDHVQAFTNYSEREGKISAEIYIADNIPSDRIRSVVERELAHLRVLPTEQAQKGIEEVVAGLQRKEETPEIAVGVVILTAHRSPQGLPPTQIDKSGWAIKGPVLMSKVPVKTSLN